MIVLIDTGVLGLLCNPNPSNSKEARECLEWLDSLLMKSRRPISSEICEYELRRNLVQEKLKNSSSLSRKSLQILDSFHDNGFPEFLPISRDVLIEAANIWAKVRVSGQPTSTKENLDADCIIGAHYRLLKEESPGQDVVIATTNIKHLSRFSNAMTWREI